MEEYHSLDWLNDDDAGDFGAQVVFHVPQAVAAAAAAEDAPPPAPTHGWPWHLFHPGHKDT